VSERGDRAVCRWVKCRASGFNHGPTWAEHARLARQGHVARLLLKGKNEADDSTKECRESSQIHGVPTHLATERIDLSETSTDSEDS
jgi:hypothetical protein